MLHGPHTYAKASNMAKATMCAYSYSDHSLPHWKFLLRWCADCPRINIPEQETYIQYSYTTPSIRFHVYHIIAHFTDHGKIILKDNKIYHM